MPVRKLGSDVRAILEPSIEEYAFVTPRDAGSPFFAVSIKYRVNVYLPDGKLADSWGFTGYGTSPSQGLSSQTPLATATALAMRDAGAKLAVEFREQAIVRGLLPASESVDARPVMAPATTTPAVTTTPAPESSGTPGAPTEPKDAAGAPAGAPVTPQPQGEEDTKEEESKPPIEPEAFATRPA